MHIHVCYIAKDDRNNSIKFLQDLSAQPLQALTFSMTLAEKFDPVCDVGVWKHVHHWRGQLDVGHNDDPDARLFDVLTDTNSSGNTSSDTSLCILIATWLNAFQRRQDDVQVNRSARDQGVKCKLSEKLPSL